MLECNKQAQPTDEQMLVLGSWISQPLEP
jgi:hypothetical protein